MAGGIDVTGLLGSLDRRSVKQVEADILAELRSHLEQATSENI